jgi:hypothetical protein
VSAGSDRVPIRRHALAVIAVIATTGLAAGLASAHFIRWAAAAGPLVGTFLVALAYGRGAKRGAIAAGLAAMAGIALEWIVRATLGTAYPAVRELTASPLLPAAFTFVIGIWAISDHR